jgi:hypothetical protein
VFVETRRSAVPAEVTVLRPFLTFGKKFIIFLFCFPLVPAPFGSRANGQLFYLKRQISAVEVDKSSPSFHAGVPG